MAGTASAPVRFGIKARLFLAVGLLVLLTLLASLVAWIVFRDIEAAVGRVTAQSLPAMVTALSLEEMSSEVAAAAPALAASATAAELARREARMDRRLADMAGLVEQLRSAELVPEATAHLTGHQAQVGATLEDLTASTGAALRDGDRREVLVARLADRHQKFAETLEPLIDDAVFDMVISGEREASQGRRAISRLVEGGVGRIDALLTIESQTNLAAGLMGQAAFVEDPARLPPLEERFTAAADTIRRRLQDLAPRGGIAGGELGALQEAVEAMLAYGDPAGGIFAQRAAVAGGGGTGEEVAVLGQEAAAMRQAHEALLLQLAPMVDDASFNLVTETAEVSRTSGEIVTGLIDIGTSLLHTLLTIRAEGNLVWGLLSDAANVPDPSMLGPLTERFTAAEATIARMLAELPPTLHPEPIKAAASGLLDFGRGEDSLFTTRRDELHHQAQAAAALEDSRRLADAIGTEVAALVRAARAQSEAAASGTSAAISAGQLAMLLFTAISLVAAAILLGLYVVPQILHPLERITASMSALAGGDTAVDIPGRDRRDELGRMAQALGVFRDTAIEMQQSNLREIRETRSRLQDAIESISEGFSLYDSDDRLVVANTKYQQLMHPGLAGEVVPGMTFEQIIRRSAERGYVQDAKGRVDEWVAERVAKHRNPGPAHIHRRGELWVLVSERKTEDGGTVALYSDITELKQREQELASKTQALEQLSSQLAKYLSPQVYESIFTGRQEVKIASQRKKLTVFFSDIAGFTETADRMESEDLTQVLNQYLTEMSKIALAHGATIDKYVGDAIVIFFGDPTSKGVREDALACLRMAVEMRQRMRQLQKIWRDAGIEKPMQTRMGINTGYCTVGNFGSEDRMDYTIIGGGVNLAARLETAAPPGEILVSYETHALVKDEIACEEHGKITVKGIAEPVTTYRVLDAEEAAAQAQRRIRAEAAHLKLEADPDLMSPTERAEAQAMLRQALERLSG
ncbi:adenylate/guanylate cyclase domain-containing protein [Marinibaculum pumilum]|uniref:Adenylate/guanylate cyclase domain-containing protein n=1 Tax=Marinibaculum pumilum TaxID=1766165 RepID=A0ABV7L395_9PROT